MVFGDFGVEAEDGSGWAGEEALAMGVLAGGVGCDEGEEAAAAADVSLFLAGGGG